MISARHAKITGNKLWEERQIKSDENNKRRKSSPAIGIHSTANLGPPVVQTTQITKHSSTNHDVVEVGYDKVCVGNMDVDGEGREKKPGHSANRKETDKPKRVKHRRVERDRTSITVSYTHLTLP